MHVDFYSQPEVYDILHAPGTAGDVRAAVRTARRFVPVPLASQTWLEPACGTARHLRALARLGVRTIGFDLEPAMVAYAKRAIRADAAENRPRVFAADMRAFDRERRLPRVNVAFNLINTIRHLGSDAAMLDHFRAIARVLAPGGVYLVGVSLAAYGLESPTEDVWIGRRGRTRVTQVVQYEPPSGSRGEAARAERVISHKTITRGTREEHIDSTYALRSYNLSQWRALVAKSPLREIGVADSDGRPAVAREPGYYVFVLGV